MRGIAYGIAAIAAIGIMVAISMMPEQSTTDSPTTAPATAVSASPDVKAEAGTLTLSVPHMHCAVACYPRVKEMLENSDGIQEVELAEQKEEGVIDNRQVIVKYEAGFDVDSALQLLAKEGFEDSDVVQ